jgi:adenosylmethionine-8-amino-7-oxononanoate aminotransferase
MGAGLGHGNPEIAEAVEAQIKRLAHTRNHPSEVRAELMERLAAITPGDLNLFAFYSSGTEATEGRCAWRGRSLAGTNSYRYIPITTGAPRRPLARLWELG